MPGSVIVGSARTPIGKLSGALAGFSATDLGGLAIKAALERAGVDAEQVDYVLMGQVLLGGQGQITARQAAVKAGIPMDVPALTINKVCLSGIDAIYLADQMIQAGDAEVVVAGGMESMTNAPYLLPGARAGYRMGNAEVVDSLINDGLWCAFDAVHMGAGTENYVGAGRRASRARRRTTSRRRATSVPPPRRRKAASPTRSRRCRSRSARATRWCSTPTKASGPAPPSSRSPGSVPRSTATAASPPATRRRSPMAVQPSS